MKKFLVFLVAIITTVCIGVTFYQFARNDEIIKVNTQTIYINYGEQLSLDDIGFSHEEASKQTSINFNAGGEEVTSIIAFDEVSQCYIPTSKGGSTTIQISTTNRKYKLLTIDVVVGIGTEEFPYYITTESQLFDLCNQHIDSNAYFELVNDITLTKPHSPIGFINGAHYEFTGKFNGKYHTISNLTIESCDYAGLFAIMGANSSVYNLNIDNATIKGDFINVGAVAGKCFGNINKVVVSNATINNNKSTSNTGTVVGLLQTDSTNNVTASIMRTSAYTDQNTTISSSGTLGGLVGTVNSALVHACYTKLNLVNNSVATTGGLVGNLVVNQDTYIRESYSISQIQTKGTGGNIVGSVTLSSNTQISELNKALVFVGLYYDSSLNNLGGVGTDANGFATATNFAICGKSTNDMKSKNTYIYYINSSNNIVYWDKVWYLVDGEYPSLTFAGNFDDIVLEGDNQHQTSPDISNPDNPNATAVVISNKQELINVFQTGKVVNGNYILGANIDLGGMDWKPVNFTGTFKSSQNQNYTISNFNIVDAGFYYVGFFYSLTSATISNITFSTVTLSTTNAETAAIVVGHIRGNVIISNVNVLNSTISTTVKYAGGIAGYITNIAKLEKCTVQNINIEKAYNAGGIVGYVPEDGYIIACKVKNSNDINAIDRVGGIAAVNRGFISDCMFSGNVDASATTTSGYVGGLCGVNYNSITYSTTYAEINVKNTSSGSTNYFVGGISGYNLGNINYCSAYAEKYSAKESSNTVYIGGLTAYNKGNIDYCVVDVANIGSINNKIYVAGLSVFNYGGNIFGCFGFGDLSGYQVAGLVRTNSDNGTIDSCMTGKSLNDISEENSRANYKGVNVASFVYEISSGNISNCLVSANLICSNNDGWVAGFAGFMSYTNNKFGTISYSIANVSLKQSKLGSVYLDIAQDGLMKKNRTTGTVTNCVITNEYNAETTIVAERSKRFGKILDAGSDSNYVIKSISEMKNLQTYLQPDTCNFDISAGLNDSKWLYVNSSSLPLPRPVLELFGYDIIGL